MKLKLLTGGLVVLAWGGFLATAGPVSQDSTTPELAANAGLEEMVRYALEQSPRVRSVFEEWKAAVERPVQERSLPDPQLNYGNFVFRSAERQGMMGRQTISVTQMFPWFGTLSARGSRAEQAAYAAAYRLEAEANRLVAEVRKQYAEYYYVEASGAIFEEHRLLLDRLREAIEAQYEAAVVGRADLLRIEMDLERVTEEERTLRERLVPVRARLNTLLGRPADAPLPPPRPWEYAPLPEAELRELALRIDGNPELLAREREIRAAEEGIRLARKRGWPDLMLGAQALERRGETTEGMLMFGMSLPIWRDNYAAGRREAEARRRQARAGHESFALELQARFADAVFGVRDAERWLRRFDESLLPLAAETYETLDLAYAQGEAGFLDVTRAQRELLELRQLRVRSLADHAQRLAELRELAGRGAPESFQP